MERSRLPPRALPEEGKGWRLFELSASSVRDLSEGACVKSRSVMVGTVPLRLSVYPKGNHESSGSVSLFVEIWADADWPQDWSIPDVPFSITLLNQSERKHVRRSHTNSFSAESPGLGWPSFLSNESWAKTERDGFLFCGNELRFRLGVEEKLLLAVNFRSLGRKLWSNLKFTDMVISGAGDGPPIKCHRHVIAAASTVFERMLETEMQEAKTQEIVIRNARDNVLQLFVQYIYEQELPASYGTEELQELMQLGDQYNVCGLARRCSTMLLERISKENVAEVVRVLRSCKGTPGVADDLASALELVRQSVELMNGLVEGLVEGM